MKTEGYLLAGQVENLAAQLWDQSLTNTGPWQCTTRENRGRCRATATRMIEECGAWLLDQLPPAPDYHRGKR